MSLDFQAAAQLMLWCENGRRLKAKRGNFSGFPGWLKTALADGWCPRGWMWRVPRSITVRFSKREGEPNVWVQGPPDYIAKYNLTPMVLRAVGLADDEL